MNATQRNWTWVRACELIRGLGCGLSLFMLRLRTGAPSVWQAPARAARAVARAARAVARVLAECHRIQRDLLLLRLQPDRYALNGDSAPDTYAEFLFRCPATVWHEPSARERAESTPRKPFGRDYQ